MNPGSLWKSAMAALLVILVGFTASCASPPATTSPAPSTTSPAPSTSVSPAVYSQYQLEYLLFSQYPDFFWCDPDFYPIGRPGIEESNAQQQFPEIQANTAEFSAILDHLSLAEKATYTAEEQLEIYREHKKLTRALNITPSGGLYNFSLRVGKDQGQLIEGTITSSGQIKVTRQETSFNTCPICLTSGTLIDTPAGRVPVEQLQVGMTVWTVDPAGQLAAVPVIKIASVSVPPSFKVVKVSLDDGRTISAAPGHPTGDNRALGEYQTGDSLDRGRVISVELIDYWPGTTHDILPAGPVGVYRANGIWLKSTLN